MTKVNINGVKKATTDAKDERCILFTCALDSTHHYVRVSSGPSVAFAQLRRQENGSAASRGLLEALRLSNGLETLQVETIPEDHFESGEATCKCKCGVVASVCVAFLTRTKPPPAVVRAMQHVAGQLLTRVIVWEGRQSSVSWLNCKDAIEFLDVAWETTGSGCCAQVGMISRTSNVTLSFHGDGASATAMQKYVDVYVTQIASELGGVAKYARNLLEIMWQRMGSEQVEKPVRPSVGALVCGLPGIGKTALAKAICKVLGVKVIVLNAADIFQTYTGQSETQLVNVFDRAIRVAPSILLIDGIEAIAGPRRALVQSESALEAGVLGALLSLLENLKATMHKVFVLSTTNRRDDVDAAVLSNGRLDHVVTIEPPTQVERLEMLQVMTNSWQVDRKCLYQFSKSTGGFVGADLLSLCQKALQACLNEAATPKATDPTVCPRHFELALAGTFPSILQTHYVSHQQHPIKSSTSLEHGTRDTQTAFSSVYGLDDAIQTLHVSLIEPLVDCSRFLRFGTTPPKGILLTGAPGSGKTYLANAVANEVRRRGLASFVSVQCSDLLTTVVGDTEKALCDLFATARKAAPCVLYFDQIESLAPLRGFDTSTEQTLDRMLSLLLIEMDGFHTSHTMLAQSLANDEARMAFLKQHVVILASTTNKELLDPAILRPGRFDIHIHVEFPDEDARCAIIAQALTNVAVDYSSDPIFNSREALATHVAKHTRGLSAADITSILREAAMAAMRENLEATSVAIKHVLQALSQLTISTPARIFTSNQASGRRSRYNASIERPVRSSQARQQRESTRRLQ